MTPPRKRHYYSPLRARRAEATRQRILAVARRQFARHGYAATRLESVAEEAGVAVQTVYQSFGSKARLLEAQLDAMDEIGGLAELRAVVDDPSASPREMTRALARFITRLLDGAGEILEAARMAGRADPAIQRVLQGGLQRHNRGVAGMTRRWGRTRALRDGLSAADVAAIVASLSGPDVYYRLTRDWRWSPTRYETWLADAIERLVLAPEAKTK